MTAINPARLKIQCAELSELFEDPDQFIPKLHTLLDFYAVRLRQTGLSSSSLLLQSYQVSPPVLRALERELKDSLERSPAQGLALIDALWKEEWLETRTLAVNLLGSIPPINPEVILKRLESWISSKESEAIRNILTTRGLNRLKTENPGLILTFFQHLLSAPSQESLQAVLFGLIPFIEDQQFDNLPIIYQLMDSILLVEEKGLNNEIQKVLKSLIIRSEQETLFFLERQLTTAAKPEIFRIIRQALPFFSKDNQSFLRKAMEKYS